MQKLSGVRRLFAKAISYLHSSVGNYLDVCLGALIGIGGTNEYSVIGMITWTIINWKFNWSGKNQLRHTWRDLTIASITTLCLFFYSFNEIPGDTSGLTTVEFIKVIIWGIFSLTLIRSEQNKLFAVVNGIGIGLWFYTLIILSGSLIIQPFQSARGMMFNLMSNEFDAAGSIVGYTCANSALIFLGLKSPLALPASLTCIVLGIHSLNRISLLVGTIVLAYLALAKGYTYSKQSYLSEKLRVKAPIVIGVAGVLVLGLIASSEMLASFIHNYMGFIDITARMQNIENDPRYYLYSAGFRTLKTSILDNNLALMLNTNQAVSRIYPDWSSRFQEPGWHSLILDSARGAGWIGLFMSITWLASLSCSTILAAINRNSRYVLMGITQILILLTSMPVALGHYELLGALTLTTLLIYLPKFRRDGSSP